jgi:hypothetical protein
MDKVAKLSTRHIGASFRLVSTFSELDIDDRIYDTFSSMGPN